MRDKGRDEALREPSIRLIENAPPAELESAPHLLMDGRISHHRTWGLTLHRQCNISAMQY